MPIATLQPPADPITIYCTSNAATGLWSAKLSNGTVVSTEFKNVANDVIIALASKDQSTLLNIISPSGNLMVSSQLHTRLLHPMTVLEALEGGLIRRTASGWVWSEKAYERVAASEA